MSEAADKFIFGFFAVIALMIVFVRAGQYGGRTGGAQTADIINAGAGGLANLGGTLGGK